MTILELARTLKEKPRTFTAHSDHKGQGALVRLAAGEARTVAVFRHYDDALEVTRIANDATVLAEALVEAVEIIRMEIEDDLLEAMSRIQDFLDRVDP